MTKRKDLLPKAIDRVKKELLKEPYEPIYREIADKIEDNHGSEILPRIIKKIADLEQAEVLKALPGNADELAEKLGMEKGLVEKHLRYLFERGLIFRVKTSWTIGPGWGLLHDSLGQTDRKYDDDDLNDLCFAYLWERTTWPRPDPGFDAAAIPYVLRVIPKWKSIRDIAGVLPLEDIRQILKWRKPIAVAQCPCTKWRRERDCVNIHATVDKCMSVGQSVAAYHIERGSGRELSYEEALTLIEEWEGQPLFHAVPNISDSMPPIICNCCPECCGVFEFSPSQQRPSFAKSRFEPVVDTGKCRASKVCVDKCPVGAITVAYDPQLKKEISYTDTDLCIGCGTCTIVCPEGARSMKTVRPPESIPELKHSPIAQHIILNEYPEDFRKDFIE